VPLLCLLALYVMKKQPEWKTMKERRKLALEAEAAERSAIASNHRAQARLAHAQEASAKAEQQRAAAEAAVAAAQASKVNAEAEAKRKEATAKEAETMAMATAQAQKVASEAKAKLVEAKAKSAEVTALANAAADEAKAKLVEAEAAKVKADADKALAERQKANDDAQRAQAESDKARAEAQKAQAEVDKANAEMERAQAETTRQKVHAEAQKANDDAQRAQAESDKARAEAQKAQAELDKANAEMERAQAEMEKAQAETTRQKANADAQKANADKQKAQADAQKAQADAQKAQAETQKAQAESDKAQAEAEKVSKKAAMFKAIGVGGSSKVLPVDDVVDVVRGLQQPEYWEKTLAANAADNLAAIPLDRDGHDRATWAALERLLETDKDKLQANGKDRSNSVTYEKLRMARAWRLENPMLWEEYLAGRGRVKRDMQVLRKAGVKAAGGDPPATARIAASLPGTLNADVNEAILLHGTNAAVLPSIMVQGMNERFAGSSAGAAYGEGSYLAEDAGKNDQYVTVDAHYDRSSDLHKRLYNNRCRHPNDVFYIVVCRVALGHHVRTTETGVYATSCDTGEQVYASGAGGSIIYRELAKVPGLSTASPVHHHSLLVDVIRVHMRYREFVVFHSDLIYPEYVIAYKRE